MSKISPLSRLSKTIIHLTIPLIKSSPDNIPKNSIEKKSSISRNNIWDNEKFSTTMKYIKSIIYPEFKKFFLHQKLPH
jgi:hypothetical protein